MGQADIWFEIVYVLRDFQLLDAESYQRTYIRRDGQPLAKGYYIVSWPPGGDVTRFGAEAVFHGPFMRRRDAATNMYRLQRLLKAHGQTALDTTPVRDEFWRFNADQAEHEQPPSDKPIH